MESPNTVPWENANTNLILPHLIEFGGFLESLIEMAFDHSNSTNAFVD